MKVWKTMIFLFILDQNKVLMSGRKNIMTQTGDDIEAKAGRWTFGGDVAKNFDNHIKKSVPGYEEGHNLVAKLAPL